MALDSATLLASIVADGHIVVPVVRLTEALDATPGEIRKAARDLVKRGVVAHWPECPDGPALVLTPAAVEQLGLEPDDAGRRFIPRGSRRLPERIDDRRAINESAFDLDGGNFLDLLPDSHAIDPATAAERNEASRLAMMHAEEVQDDRPSPARSDAIAKARGRSPMLIVGVSATWPVPFVAGQRCQVCEGERRTFVCLVCNCSSLDHIVGRPPNQAALDRQAGRYIATDAKGRKLRGGTEKARR